MSVLPHMVHDLESVCHARFVGGLRDPAQSLRKFTQLARRTAVLKVFRTAF